MVKALVAVFAAVCLLALVPLAFAPVPVPRTVLLVHGFGSSPSAFDTMQGRLRALGIPSIEVVLPGQDNVANAAAIGAAVADLVREQGPATTVDIVAHSMGGLSARWYARFVGGSPAAGTARIAHYVSLGTPQYGLEGTCNLPAAGGGQMCPTGPFLAQLNDGDDTPGVARYTTIFSADDGVVPTSAARLDGGACVVRVSGVGHFDLRTDPGVFSDVVTALRDGCPGQITTA